MKTKTLKNLLFECFLGFFTVTFISLFILSIAVIFFIPITNYHHTTGIVEYVNQYNVVSPLKGIIVDIKMAQGSTVYTKDTIIKIYSEERGNERSLLDVNKELLKKEHETLSRMYANGSINLFEIQKKELEIASIEKKQLQLGKDCVIAPINGLLWYAIDPEYLKGQYVKEGDVIAYIFPSKEKHIKLSTSHIYADRFRLGSNVIIKYKDPVSFVIKKFTCKIYRSYIDKAAAKIDLYCADTNMSNNLEVLAPYTQLEAYISVNHTSFSKDLFGVDLFPESLSYIRNSSTFKYLKKVIGIQNIF